MSARNSGASPRPSDLEAIEATAAAWLAQRDDGFTGGEAAAFAGWQTADPRHAAAVARLERAWASLQQLRDFRPEARMHPDRDLLAGPARGRKAVPFPVYIATALAACLTLVAALGWYGIQQRQVGAELQRYVTAMDGYERVTLEDGSLLELNSNTAVSVRYTANERRVRLVRGEAYFTVVRIPDRPFSVEAGALAVRAVGTAFKVRLGSHEVEVLVTEGRVQVAESAAPASRPPAVPLLVANERAIIPAPTRSAPGARAPWQIEKIAPEVVRRELAWQTPRIVFRETPLAEVAAQFNRRNSVELVLADRELDALPVGGSFRAENVDAFVRLIEAGGDIVADRSDPRRIVLRKAR